MCGINPLELGVQANVESATAVAHLAANPPSLEQAKGTFAFMNQLSFSAADVKRLREVAFIPAPQGHFKPDEVLLSSSADAAALISSTAPSSASSRRKGAAKGKGKAKVNGSTSTSSTKSTATRASKRKAKAQDVIVIDEEESEGDEGGESGLVADLDDDSAAFAANVPEKSLSHPKLLADALKVLLVCVDFGPEGNQFLLTCQVQTKPTADKLASLMLSMSDNVLSMPDGERMYLALLLHISDVLSSISKPMMTRLKQEPWLLGYHWLKDVKKDKKANSSSGSEASSAPAVPAALSLSSTSKNLHPLGSLAGLYSCAFVAEPRRIFLVDDTFLERLLCPLVCPQVEDTDDVFKSLNRLYEHVGCQWLSSAAVLESSPSGKLQQTPFSASIQAKIQERAALLVLTPRGTRQQGITEAAERRLHQLAVREVDGIVQTVTFQGKTLNLTSSNSISCCMAPQGKQGSVLCVVRSPTSHLVDMYFVSKEIAKLLFNNNISSSIVSEMKDMLQEDLDVLLRRGVPVQQLISRSRGKRPALDEILYDDDGVEIEAPVAPTKVIRHEDRVPVFAAPSEKNIERLLQQGRAATSSRIKSGYEERVETSQECVIDNDLDLQEVPTPFSGIRLYMDKRVDQTKRADVLKAAALFGSLLSEICTKVFGGSAIKSVHMYYDVDGGKIAFNRDGSIFCNLRYFTQIHKPKIPGASAPSLVSFSLNSPIEKKICYEW